MTDDRFKIKKNVLYSIAAFAINILLLFISYKLVITVGGLEMLGLWSVLFAWTSLLKVGEVGLANATLRFVALQDVNSSPRAIARVIDTSVLTNTVIVGLLAVVAYVILSQFLHLIVEPQYLQLSQDVLPVMFLCFVLTNVFTLLTGAFTGLHRAYLSAQMTVVGNVLQLGFVLWLVPRYGILGLAWAKSLQYLVSIVVCWIWLVYLVPGKAWLPLQFHWPDFKKILGFSMRSQLASLSNGLYEPVSKILIGHFAGVQFLGIYELAYKAIFLPRNAVISGVSALIPALTAVRSESLDRAQDLYRSSVRRSIIPIVLVCAVLVLASPLISRLWIGYVEWDLSVCMAIVAIGVCFNSYGASAYNLAVVTGRMRNNIIVNTSILFTMVLVGTGVGMLWNSYFLVAVIMACMAWGGLWIKASNERTLLA